MKRHSTIDPSAAPSKADSTHNPDAQIQGERLPAALGELPNRLLTAFEVAEFVGCHEETVRRAYLRGLLNSTRFGVRGRRIHPRDVLDWIRRGAPTRVS
jgi:excisionase family DNA binding protein